MAVAGLCAGFSFYTAWAMLEAGDTRGPWLFVAFGCLFAFPIFAATIKAAARRIPLFGRVDRVPDRGVSTANTPRSAFVPHRQMMTLIALALLGILAALLVPILVR
jgi:hypothetical protein